MSDAVPTAHAESLANLLLATADDKLMLGHRNSEWTGLGPMLEEDIAFSSLAQDEIGHAQSLYELAGRLLDRDPDALAFGRAPEAYRCAALASMPDEFDWALAIGRRFLIDHYDGLRLARLATSSWTPLAALGRRLAAEQAIHREHADGWIVRLGQGTDDSRQRMQAALDRLAPIASGLFEPVPGEADLVEAGLYPRLEDVPDMYEAWAEETARVADRAGLAFRPRPRDEEVTAPGGRSGVHDAEFTALLDEMCEVYRIEPEAAW